jgi:hypothetical protein
VEVNPRASANPMRTPTWSAVVAIATSKLPTTSKPRGIGAVSNSGWAPLIRSTITLSPENIVFSGINRPIVPIATKDS